MRQWKLSYNKNVSTSWELYCLSFQRHIEIFRTTAWTLHPNYDNTDFEKGNDIAVIDIRGQGLTLSDTVKPVCKPTVRPVLNDILTIMGWGITEAGTVSPVLKRARIYKIA